MRTQEFYHLYIVSLSDMKQRELSIAKINRPKLARVYDRERLFRLLDQGREKPVTWISGPAGSGKTTLAASWLDSRKLPCLWYQVDEGDGDIATFFYYMGLAGKKAAPRVRKPLPLLTPEYAFGIPTFTRRYFEELYSRLTSSRGHVLVFDNYHHIPEASPLHEAMQIGLSTIPEGVTVIVTSRAEPPAMFSGLRANKQMEALGWEALRLTPEESRGIVRLEKGRQFPAGAVTTLHEKAGGWAAGLILMAKGTGKAGETRADGALRPEETFDYFASELFDRAEKPVRDFLLRTAVLPKMTPDMAEKLTKNRNAGTILAGLNRRNYFTEKRDDSGPTYQYHPLFRHFLQSRAAELFTPVERANIQTLAAELLERDGSIEDAAELYQTAGDSEGLVRMIVRHAPTLIGQGRCRTLDQWINSALSGERVDNPWLLFWRGVCSQPIAPPSARRNFERALELFAEQRDNTGELLAWSGIVETFLYEWNDFTPLDRWIRWLDGRAKKGIVYPSAAVEARVSYSMAAALTIVRPEDPKLPKWWERALALQRAANDVSLSLQVLSYAASYYIWLGDLAATEKVSRQMSALTSAPQASPLARLTWKCHEAIMDIWVLSQSAEALKKVAAALSYADETGVHVWDHIFVALGAYGSLVSGEWEGGREFIRKQARTLAPNRRHGYCQYHYLIAWERMLAGDIAAAKTNAEAALNLAEETGFRFPCILCGLELVQVLLGLDSVGRAAVHVERAHDLALRSKSAVLEYAALLAKAQVAFSRGRDTSGLRSLGTGLRLGKEQGYMNQFWWHHPSSLANLCARALHAGIEVEYVQDLITRHRLRPDPDSVPPEAWPWPVKIYALGRFRVDVAGKPLKFSGKVRKKPLEMLKALIAFGGREVQGEQIAAALWPDADGDAAYKAFGITLIRLRELLGVKDAVQLREGNVTLDRRYFWIDVWAFEHTLESSEFGVPRSALHAQERQSAIGKRQSAMNLGPLEKAINLYAGPFLGAESAFWAIPLRERLRDKFLRSATTVGMRWEEKKEWDKAITCYRKGLEADDLAEEFYRRIIICYERLGRHAEALSVYNRCKKTLASYGIELSPETEEIRRELAGGKHASPHR